MYPPFDPNIFALISFILKVSRKIFCIHPLSVNFPFRQHSCIIKSLTPIRVLGVAVKSCSLSMASEKKAMSPAVKQQQENFSEVDEDTSDVNSDEGRENEDTEEPEEDTNAEEKNETKEESEEGAGDGKREGDEHKVDRTGKEKTEKSEKKRSKRGTVELKSPTTPGSERPTRERKIVERFKLYETPKSSASKTLSIEKGQGTQLKDIPNVAFKLSKRKADENLQLLHTILYGKKAKVHSLKRNLGLFSGFVWAENEEKQKAKTKEKFDKCIKEKLLDFCDVLNIPAHKTSSKKEELVVKLLEFLESPHATTDTLLADKEKVKKRRSKAPSSKSPSSHVTGGKSTKKQKSDSDSSKKQKSLTKEENDDKSDPSSSDDDKDHEKSLPKAESDHEDNDVEDQISEEEPEKQKPFEKVSSKKSAEKDAGKDAAKSKSATKGSPPESSKASTKSKRKSVDGVAVSHAISEQKSKVKAAPSTKKRKAENESEKDTKGASSSKKKSKPPLKVLENDQDSKGSDKEVEGPSREEMHATVVALLKEADFNTATLADILKQLGKHFAVDLSHRKREVKDIITEVIKNMSDDEDDKSGNESGKEEDN